MSTHTPWRPGAFAIVVGFAMLCGGAVARADDAAEVKITFTAKVPPGTPADAKVFIAGDAKALGGWKVDGVELKKGEDGAYVAVVSLPAEKAVEYKLNRGTWETVEKNADGTEMSNRTLTPTKDAKVEIEVKAWADQAGGAPKPPAEKKSTRTGDIRVHEKFYSRALQNDRDLFVYLPPGYATDTARRYPVLYMQDGQNLFDDATSFAGEWRADETAQRLIGDDGAAEKSGEKKMQPIIIVGIANTKARMAEYTPWPDAKEKQGGQGDAYAAFVAEEVKPFIDKVYRTKPKGEDTAIGGSSLGGLIALRIGEMYPSTFGKVAAMSPSLWWNDRAMIREIQRDQTFRPGTKVWIDTGSAEGATSVDDLRLLAAALEKGGMKRDQDYSMLIVDGAKHNEQAWAARLDRVFLFLFPA